MSTKTIEQKARAYDEALKCAEMYYKENKDYNAGFLPIIFPQLKESEDERIRKGLIDALYVSKSVGELKFRLPEPTPEECIEWLEKQKENPKSADSIPSDRVSLAKSEDRWHKVGDSMPDNPREVLCKDEAGNYFIGRYYVGEGWEISNYDDEDKPHHLNPPVSMWIDFPSEKQKEPHYTKRNALFDKCVENCDPEVMKSVSDEVDEMLKKEQKPSLCDECKKKSTCLDTKYGDDRVVEQCINFVKMKQKTEWSDTKELVFKDICNHLKEEGYSGWVLLLNALRNGEFQPKPEWSEEDEKKILFLERLIRYNVPDGQYGWVDGHKGGFVTKLEAISMLKSLRPQPKKELSIEKAIQWLDDTFIFLDNSSGRGKDCEITTHDFDSLEEMYDSFRKAVIVDSEPHWKPSEDEERLINTSISFLKDFADKGYENAVECIDWLKSKSHGNSGK